MVEDMTACLPTLVRMKVDPAIGINLIRYCINPRASYLARVQDVEAIPALHQFDVAVDIAICRVAEHTHRLTDEEEDNGHRPITITATVRGLPLHHGGLGIQRHSGISGQVGCLRSRSLTAAFVEEHFSETRRFGQAVASWPAMAIGAGHADEDPSQDQGAAVNFRDRVEAAYLAMASDLHTFLLTTDGMQSHASWFLSSRFEGSGRWISPPVGLYLPPNMVLCGEQYRQALRARLLLHPLEEQLTLQPELSVNCHCHREGQVDNQQQAHPHMLTIAELFHCLDCCRNKGLVKGRHDAVVQVIEDFIRKRFTGVNIVKEPLVQTHPDVQQQVRADMLVSLPQAVGRHFIIDVTISNPAAPIYRAAGVRSHQSAPSH
jgi:hypothetical protein